MMNPTVNFIQLDPEHLRQQIELSVRSVFNEMMVALPKQPIEDKLYTPKEAAEYLKVNLSTISNWRSGGILSSHQIGGRVYIKQSDIDNALVKVNARC